MGADRYVGISHLVFWSTLLPDYIDTTWTLPQDEETMGDGMKGWMADW